MSVTYRPAPSVQRIAADLIPKHHQHLVDVRVDYVFRSKAAKTGGKTVFGKARKMSGLNAYLAQQDSPDEAPAEEALDFFVIEIAEDIWALLDQGQRIALVDHELCHCLIEFDDDGDATLKMKPHDLEEFKAVVERHGLWRPDVVEFAAVITQGRLDLADEEPAA